MAKNKTVLKLEKGTLLIITKANFDEFATASSFSEELKEIITNIANVP